MDSKSSSNPSSSSSSNSNPPPAASSNARHNPFAYQTRLLERSTSRSSNFSLSNEAHSSSSPSSASVSPGGLSQSNSIRAGGGTGRYPMPHRHTSSLDPSRRDNSLLSRNDSVNSISNPNSPVQNQTSTFSSNGSLASSSSNSNSFSNRSPTLNSANNSHYGTTSTSPSSLNSSTPSNRSNRPFSMPPPPRNNDSPSASTSTTPTSYRRPVSPTKVSPFDHPPPPRSSSPTKWNPASSFTTPNSPGKEDNSWISNPNNSSSSSSGAAAGAGAGVGGGSFWSQPGNHSNHHTPSQVHLGGVSDLKRSSVGALKMMRDFTTKGGAGEDGSSHTRMTVGKGSKRGSTLPSGIENLSLKEDDEWKKPERPGRMESEDQEGGEIVIPGITDGAEDVAGLSGRIRLSRQGPPPSNLNSSTALPSSLNSNLSPLRSSTATTNTRSLGGGSKWMDTQRHLLQAYEYLCHCGEAKEWMEHCVNEKLGDVVEMENSMRDGVFLAKLAKVFEPSCVPRIFAHPKLQYKHTDNINYFFRFVQLVGLPIFFQFELTDLYEKKNFPKVVYCIHALSHILARQGRAVKVGNLVGKLEFTDDQLQKTQRGLDAAGVAMPSFGGVGKALAKEMNVEPEPEPETEEERIDRELAENLSSVLACQAICRGALARLAFSRKREEAARLAEEKRLRAEAEQRRREEEKRQRREEEERQRREEERQRREEEERRREEERLRLAEESRLAKLAEEARLAKIAEEERIKAENERIVNSFAPKLQAQALGLLARKDFHRKQAELRTNSNLYSGLQAHAKGVLLRKKFFQNISSLDKHETGVVAMQAQVRGALARKAYEELIFSLSDATEDVIKLQSACRAALARRGLLSKIRGLRSSADGITGVQSQVRGMLARQKFWAMSTALQKAEVTKSVGGLQSFARAAIARKKHSEQKKKLDFVAPDVVGVQSQIRGFLVRREHDWWVNHVKSSEPVAIHLQSLFRGLLARRAFNSKMRHYHEHMDKIVKIQSLFRGKQQGEQYRSLTVGKNVPVSTIKNFGHLLNDSDHDFEDEIEVERLRKLVVRNIRENQTLENDVSELDTKIALLVKNKIGIEELIKAKNERGLLGKDRDAAALQRKNSLLVAAGDAFAEMGTMDRATRKKLELYQELFYTLQTRPEYLARLFARVTKMEMADRQRKQVEKIVLTLFGYAQKAREEYLLLKLFQRCVTEELTLVNSVQEFMRGNAQFIKLVVQYNRGAKERKYLRELLSPLVRGIMDDDALDLETDPCAIYRGTINTEEMQTGQPSRRPLDVNFHEALADPMARTIFIRHLQALRGTTEAFLSAIIYSTKKMPFGIRYIAREVFRALQAKFPNESEDALIKVVGNLVYYRYLNPAIVAPEGFDVIETLVGPVQRKNLAEVSKMLSQIAAGRLFSDDNPYLQPLNEYVTSASQRFNQWLHQVTDVPDAEMYFSADEFLDHTVQQRPVIYISPNEIYSMHLLVSQQIDHLAPMQGSPLREILSQLGPPPVSNTQELNSARDSEITLELVSRMQSLKDPEAETKALFVETKRLVLALLKVQSGNSLKDVFVAPVTAEDELAWEEIVSLEIAADRQRFRGQRPPPPPGAMLNSTPRLEDVRKLSFAELKARTLENMIELEKLGRVSRANNYQDMLNAIAIDIRNKHRKRIQRHNEKLAMHVTLQNLDEKRKYIEEQIASYHSYIDASMQTMQKKGKKRFVLPFTQQYFHIRNLKASGKVPKFGSYKYTAARLLEKGVLLSINSIEMSGKALENITLTISSDEPGLFTVEASVLGVGGGNCDLRIEDLLEAQFSGQQSMKLMDGMATVNLNLLIHLINKKFYA